MSTDSAVREPPRSDAVPPATLEKIADARALELWHEPLGRGKPIPLHDASGVYAYVYPYSRTAKAFPSHETLVARVASLRKRLSVAGPARYYAELRRFGERFGAICVSARRGEAPVLWMSHFLPDYFITVGPARAQARKRLGEDVRVRSYFYYSPEEQYVEFASRRKTVLLDVVAPTKVVSRAALRRRSTQLQSTQLASGPPVVQAYIEKRIAHWELIPVVDQTPKNWCVPTSWAMLLGFYDNYVEGKGTFLGYGRLIDHWYELTPNGFNLPNLIDELLSGAAQTVNHYTFPESKSGVDKTKQWNMLTSEVNAGRPCFFNIPGHTTLAFGYRVDDAGGRYAIVYDPPNPKVPTHLNEYSLAECEGVGAVTLGGGDDGEDLVIVAPDGGETFHVSAPNEIVWFVFGNSIKTATLSISEDGGNTWKAVAGGVVTKGAWNSYAWIGGKAGARVRFRVEGFDAGNELVAADGSFENLHVESAPSYSGWQKIWGPTSHVLAGQAAVFAVPSGGDGIYRYDGTPMAWTKIGGPGKMFALDDAGHLYGLSPDGGGVYRYDGTPMKWTQIGGPAGSLYAGGGSLFATGPQTGDIWQYSGSPMAWSRVGGPGKTFAVDAKGRLYGVATDGSAIFRYEGTPLKWSRIAHQPTTAVYAGGCGLYTTGGAGNDVYCFHLVPQLWTRVGGPGKMFAADDAGRLYGLSPDGSAVLRYDGTWNGPHTWTQLGGAAGKIFAGGDGRLFATNPQTKDLMSCQ